MFDSHACIQGIMLILNSYSHLFSPLYSCWPSSSSQPPVPPLLSCLSPPPPSLSMQILSCAGSHSYCVFLIITTRPCQTDDGISYHSCPPPPHCSPYHLSSSLAMLFTGPWRRWYRCPVSGWVLNSHSFFSLQPVVNLCRNHCPLQREAGSSTGLQIET